MARVVRPNKIANITSVLLKAKGPLTASELAYQTGLTHRELPRYIKRAGCITLRKGLYVHPAWRPANA